MQFSANLGFLWTELPLPDAIRAAQKAGFDAVECHWPYDIPAAEVRSALEETGMPMIGLNTRRGDPAKGENGLTALPGREAEARAAIDEAICYAVETGAGAVHVMAGYSTGETAHAAFCCNLEYAATRAGDAGLTLLIEPLNRHDAPGYFLRNTDQARLIIEDIGAPNLKLMFDCYHVARTEGDVTTRLGELLPIIGHIQFAGVPDRGNPSAGEIDFRYVFEVIERLGWVTPLGAEYKPDGATDASLGWLKDLC